MRRCDKYYAIITTIHESIQTPPSGSYGGFFMPINAGTPARKKGTEI
jgi:hypothetical protein